MIQLWALPTIIDAPGQYRTRCGEVVTIESVQLFKYSNRPTNTFNCKGTYSCGIKEGWHYTGRVNFYLSTISRNDIVEKIH